MCVVLRGSLGTVTETTDGPCGTLSLHNKTRPFSKPLADGANTRCYQTPDHCPVSTRHMSVYLNLSIQLPFISKLTVHMLLQDGRLTLSLVKLTSEIAQLSNARTHSLLLKRDLVTSIKVKVCVIKVARYTELSFFVSRHCHGLKQLSG